MEMPAEGNPGSVAMEENASQEHEFSAVHHGELAGKDEAEGAAPLDGAALSALALPGPLEQRLLPCQGGV